MAKRGLTNNTGRKWIKLIYTISERGQFALTWGKFNKFVQLKKIILIGNVSYSNNWNSIIEISHIIIFSWLFNETLTQIIFLYFPKIGNIYIVTFLACFYFKNLKSDLLVLSIDVLCLLIQLFCRPIIQKRAFFYLKCIEEKWAKLSMRVIQKRETFQSGK